MMMNKWLLTSWLVAPLAVVGGLWMTVDRDAARKSRHAMATLAGGMEVAGVTGGGATNGAAGKAAEGQPKMVRPESLEQGFVVVVKDLSGLANKESPIYFASSHNGWDPGHKPSRLEARSDLRWQLVFAKPTIDAPISFKFTRGNWDTTEVDENMGDVQNRSLPLVDASKLAPGEKPIIEFVIPKWQDQRPSAAARPDLNPYFRIEGKPHIKRLQIGGGGVAALRDVLVCLPPGYDAPENASRSYPVLYMQDGQNLFLEMPGTKGSWKADEAMMDLVAKGQIEPLIIVGIPHMGKARATEYLPVAMLEGVEPRGAQYTSWIVEDVMPRVERAFRIKSGPENTAIGGASLGAVIALHVASERPDRFGKVLLESMPLVNQADVLMKHFEGRKSFPPVIYFAIGGKELGGDEKNAEKNKQYAKSADAFRSMAVAKVGGAANMNVQAIVDNEGTHDEAAWARRFPGALRMLFVKPAGSK